ncbi:MAG: hypothetical protein SFY68_12990, partial [Candidatus Sumerlaeia bacterium]|nr:hypothetical protein [Candidatus Sumerlaeia bacterium]
VSGSIDHEVYSPKATPPTYGVGQKTVKKKKSRLKRIEASNDKMPKEFGIVLFNGPQGRLS